MKYLLDTNICIYLIKQKPPQVLEKFNLHSVGDIGISSITASELWYEVAKSTQKQRNQPALTQFLLPLLVLEFGAAAAEAYGQIRATLEQTGQIIGGMDMLIAAHALSLRLVLVTNNVHEFSRVPGLRIENWLEEE
jgi:tRNA(fMet)-specific endonuclease VapC